MTESVTRTVIRAAVGLCFSPWRPLSLRYIFQIQGNEKEVLIRCFALFKKRICSPYYGELTVFILFPKALFEVEFKGHMYTLLCKREEIENVYDQVAKDTIFLPILVRKLKSHFYVRIL